MAFHKVIGIDLGTTYSAVTIWDGREIVVIESKIGTRTVPSVVGLDPEGQVIVGAPAQNSMVIDPANTVLEVKRLMGTYEREPQGPKDPGVPARVRFRGEDYLPQEISAFILKELKRQAEDYIGEPVHDAVISVPAYFRDPQRRATQEAASIARLNLRQLINEPTAAAVCFGADKAEGEEVHTYAVYDLGGGTFDVSVIQVRPGNVSVVGTGGDPRLGGGDFDDRVVEWALAEIRRLHGVDLSGDQRVRRRIKREAEIRKRELSTAAATMLDLPFLTSTVSANIPLSRATFEGLIQDLLDRSLDCLDDALQSAQESNGIERDEIEQVLLVGGSTRIAKIRPMLAAHLDMPLRDIRGDINPDEVVARGAGIVARECAVADGYEGQDVADPHAAAADEGREILVLQDVTSHSLGIHVEHGHFSVILPKDSRIPGSATRKYTNAGPGTSLDVMVFQGEQPAAYDNAAVGTVPITFPESRPRDYWKLDVTFALSVDGLLHVDVKCLNNNDAWQADLHCGVQSDRAAIEESAERAERNMATPTLPTPPDAPAAAQQEQEPAPDEVPEPPAGVPEQFKSIARRSYRKVGTLEGDQLKLLRDAYVAFVRAVETKAPDVEDLGDALEEAYLEVR